MLSALEIKSSISVKNVTNSMQILPYLINRQTMMHRSIYSLESVFKLKKSCESIFFFNILTDYECRQCFMRPKKKNENVWLNKHHAGSNFSNIAKWLCANCLAMFIKTCETGRKCLI